MRKRRVVITGIGVVAPNGIGKNEFWDALVTGRSGIKEITLFDTSSFPTKIAGEIRDFTPQDFMDKQLVKRTGRSTQFAMAVVEMCLEDASLSMDRVNPYRIGLFLGTSSNAMDITERQIRILEKEGTSKVSPSTILNINPHAATGLISSILGIKGPSITISTTCNAGVDAIGIGFEEIKNGNIDIAICGASEAPLTFITFSGFCASRIMSTKNDTPSEASCPFDVKRDGGILSEGAAVIMIEEMEHAMNREAKVYAELLSYAGGSGVNNPSKFPNDRIGMEKVMEKAVKRAKITPGDIDYISAHAPSDPLLDRIETYAIKNIFQNYAYKIPVSSIKSMIGNPLAAAGPMQVIASAMAIKNKIVPPTINYRDPDPECDLDYVPNESRKNNVKNVLINSHGIGGSNASIVITEVRG